MSEISNNNLNIAGKIAKIFIQHPLTLFWEFLFWFWDFSLQIMPKEENPQIKSKRRVVIVALPDAKASEVQK